MPLHRYASKRDKRLLDPCTMIRAQVMGKGWVVDCEMANRTDAASNNSRDSTQLDGQALWNEMHEVFPPLIQELDVTVPVAVVCQGQWEMLSALAPSI